MFSRFLILIALTVGALSAGAQSRPYGEGLPLPWPFPWAKDCPVQWMDLTGRYSLVNSNSDDQVELQISIVARNGLRVMRISRFNHRGEMISDGFSFLTENQKAIRVYLWPLRSDASPIWANLKLFYIDSRFSCASERLVPILSLIERHANITKEVQYRLIRF